MPILERVHGLPSPKAGRADGAHEAQIFVDDSGRRARRVRMAGLGLVVACACWLGALTVGMAGFTGFSPIAGSRPARKARSATKMPRIVTPPCVTAFNPDRAE